MLHLLVDMTCSFNFVSGKCKKPSLNMAGLVALQNTAKQDNYFSERNTNCTIYTHFTCFFLMEA